MGLIIDKQIEKMYVKEKKSSLMIGKQLGVSTQTVFNSLRRNGISQRSRSEAAKLRMLCGRGKPPPALSGADSPHWKGGRTVNHQGYILVKAPQHPRVNANGYIREHILIWEQANGRPLPPDWVVHHINGIRDDNRAENLIAMPKHSHRSTLMLEAVQKRLRQVEAKVIQIKATRELSL